MATEIERKFRVARPDWQDHAIDATTLRQGFLSTDPERTVRVRLTDEAGVLTIKGSTEGARRAEYEYAIPPDDAAEILDRLCKPGLIEKTRYRVPEGDHVWEVDVFAGANEGLVVAEVELAAEDEAIRLPHWVGFEVTGDPRYFNSSLSESPYSQWGEE